MEDAIGKWIEEEGDVERLICEYFSKIFATTNPLLDQMNAALDDLLARITAKWESYLEQPFTREEVAEALAQMCPTKTPGPDELPKYFFRNTSAQ